MAATTTMAATADPMIMNSRCLRALAARRSSCRWSLRFAVARRCSFVGTAGVLLLLGCSGPVCQALLSVALPPTSSRRGKLDAVLITGFPSGALACNCYVLARRVGPDAIIVDPGQRAMGPLQRILDANHLTPAGVLLT